MKNICVQVTDEVNQEIIDRIGEVGLKKSEYVRSLILKDLNQKPVVKKGSSMISKLEQAFGAKSKIKKPIKKTAKKTKHKQPKRFRISPNTVFRPTKRDKKEYNEPFIKNNEIKGKGNKQRVYSTGWTIDELLVLEETFEMQGEFYYKDISEFVECLGKNQVSVRRMCYNVMVGTFDPMIAEYKKKIYNVNFNLASNENGAIIVMNNVITDITVTLAREFIAIVSNNQYLERLIFVTQKTYKSLDPIAIRVICENYRSNRLTKLLKPVVNQAVINNPGKRRNFIRNGGILE